MSGRLGNTLLFAVIATAVVLALGALLFLKAPPDPQSLATSRAAIESPSRPWIDEKYLAALGGEMVASSADGEIAIGKRACSALAEDRSAADVRTVLQAKGLSDAQAGRVMLAAVRSYCPEFAHRVNP